MIISYHVYSKHPAWQNISSVFDLFPQAIVTSSHFTYISFQLQAGTVYWRNTHRHTLFHILVRTSH